MTAPSNRQAWGLPYTRERIKKTIRRCGKVAAYSLNAFWAIPAVVIIRLIRPIAHVRLARLVPGRIGHFVADTSIFLARRSLRAPTDRARELFWLPRQTSNEQWSRMVRRRLPAYGWVRYLYACNEFIPGGGPHILELPSWSGNRAAYDIFRKPVERFSFTAREDECARSWLRTRGWTDGEPVACLFVRDKAYLSSDPLHSHARQGHYDYHNYRDSDIDTYADAVRNLANEGWWVVRMGKRVEKRLPLEHPRVIDLPFAADRDDLLDVWLTVNCGFLMTTATGLDVIPWIYGNAPSVYVNALSLFACASPINNVWVPKHLRWKATGKFLTLREHVSHNFGETDEYERAGISIQDLSSGEINLAVMEGHSRLRGTWQETEDNIRRQQRAWEIFRESPDFERLHNYVHPDARFGAEWLRSMGDSFLD